VRVTRAVKTTAAMVVTAALGVSAASAFVGSRAQVPTPQSLVAQPGSDRVVQTAPDPGGGLDWAVRSYVSTSGASCVEAGRIKDGRFGRLAPDGRFTATDLPDAGTCASLAAEPVLLAINHYPAAEQRPARTVLFGQARSDVARLHVDAPDGGRPLAAGIGGGFVLPLAGMLAPTDLPVRVTLLDGQQLTFDWR